LGKRQQHEDDGAGGEIEFIDSHLIDHKRFAPHSLKPTAAVGMTPARLILKKI
jgi:hypothetical protein